MASKRAGLTHRRWHTWILCVSLVLITLLVALVATTLLRPSFGVWLLLSPALNAVAIFLFFLALLVLATTLHLANAIRGVTKPPTRTASAGAQYGKALAFGLAVTLVVAAAPITLGAIMLRERSLVNALLPSSDAFVPKDGRYNVLIAGIDDAPGRAETRPDSITVASIDAGTGQTVMVGISRSTQNFDYPAGSVLGKAFPDGNYCTAGCGINTTYTFGESHPELFPEGQHPGMAALSEAVTGLTGLSMSGTVIVRLSGFAQLVDALGGIDLTLNREVPRTGVPHLPGDIAPEYGPPIATGSQHLNGEDSLWVARSRYDSDDDDRMQRQWCVQQAMLNTVNPALLVSRSTELAKAMTAAMSTSIPQSGIATIAQLMLDARNRSMTRIDLTPPLVNPLQPNTAFVQKLLVAGFAGEQLPLPSFKEYLGRNSKPASDAIAQGNAVPAPTIDSSDLIQTASMRAETEPTQQADLPPCSVP